MKQPGTVLANRYRIIETLEKGGMAWVYRVEDEHLGTDAVLKENMLNTEECIKQFRLEATILATLRHPNLPRVTDLFMDEYGCQYLVMDYLEGDDLRAHLERTGIMSESDVLKLGIILCETLNFLHSRRMPIFHRDIKPGNIKLTLDGQIYLLDFGIAKLRNGISATDSGARAMTPGYSPPEQYRYGLTDARSDIYSLAATLYEALTGIKPEDGLERALGNITLVPIRKRNPRISQYVAATIEKGLEIDPDNRYQTSREFEETLMHVQTLLEDEKLIVYSATSNGEVDEIIEYSHNSNTRQNHVNKKRQVTVEKSNYSKREKRGLFGHAISTSRLIIAHGLPITFLLGFLGAIVGGCLNWATNTMAGILSILGEEITTDIAFPIVAGNSRQTKEEKYKKPVGYVTFNCNISTTYMGFKFEYSQWTITSDISSPGRIQNTVIVHFQYSDGLLRYGYVRCLQ